MSEMTLMMPATVELVDCCSKIAPASAEVILAEVFVVVVKLLFISSVGIVCRLLLCTDCQCASCSVIWKLYAEMLICFLC